MNLRLFTSAISEKAIAINPDKVEAVYPSIDHRDNETTTIKTCNAGAYVVKENMATVVLALTR